MKLAAILIAATPRPERCTPRVFYHPCYHCTVYMYTCSSCEIAK